MREKEESILEAAFYDATVHKTLNYSFVSGLTWEETLEFLVLSLLEEKSVLQKELENVLVNAPQPIVIRNNHVNPR